jgi:hypothetical protein
MLLALMPAMSSAGDHPYCLNCGMIVSAPTGTTTTTSGCAPACSMPCACTEWEQYCGCEMLTSICINMEAVCGEGTNGPMQLELYDTSYRKIVTIDLPMPVEGFYSTGYTFATPIRADSLQEAVLVNENTDDPVTLTWLLIHGTFENCCGTCTYINHYCSGVEIGTANCTRMVLF